MVASKLETEVAGTFESLVRLQRQVLASGSQSGGNVDQRDRQESDSRRVEAPSVALSVRPLKGCGQPKKANVRIQCQCMPLGGLT
jgi:hypothetical protein